MFGNNWPEIDNTKSAQSLLDRKTVTYITNKTRKETAYCCEGLLEEMLGPHKVVYLVLICLCYVNHVWIYDSKRSWLLLDDSVVEQQV